MRTRSFLLVPLAVAMLVAGCGDDDPAVDAGDVEATTETTSGTTETTSGTTQTTSATTEPTDAAPSGEAVTIDDFSFEPSSLTVEPGTTVTWTNEDGVTHTVTADDGSGASFDSGPLAEGEAFEHTFDDPGTYAYHCEIHPSMTAEVVVEA